jgi:hypothetical protein
VAVGLRNFLRGRQARGVFKDQLVEGLFPQSGLRRACPIALKSGHGLSHNPAESDSLRVRVSFRAVRISRVGGARGMRLLNRPPRSYRPLLDRLAPAGAAMLTATAGVVRFGPALRPLRSARVLGHGGSLHDGVALRSDAARAYRRTDLIFRFFALRQR